MKLRIPLAYLLLSVSLACSTRSDVLKPVDAETPNGEAQTAIDPPPSSAFEKLDALFQSQGYQGVGLRYENDATLELLYKVFSDPKTQGRQIENIYTGLAMAYDPDQHSLTIGGTTKVKQIVSFIVKKVPASRKKP